MTSSNDGAPEAVPVVPPKVIRILAVEDNEDDFKLLERELRRAGYDPRLSRVDTAGAMQEALDRGGLDAIISDWSMPCFSALAALGVLQQRGLDLPFIILSGTIGEESAVRALKAGASDFVVKGNMARLGPAIERELREARVRRERKEALEQLECALASREEFFTIASHELRTPLTSLRLQVQGLLRARRAEPDQGGPLGERLQVVERTSRRLEELIDRLLDSTRLTSGGGFPLHLTEVDLSRVTSNAASSFAEAGAGGLLDVIAPRPVMGRWDEGRLDALVTNLVGNAIKYGAGKPVSVLVEDRGDEARLVVQDRGIGIASQDQERIFERYGRAVSGRSYSGFGIGLWLVRRIVDAHGGRIEVESAPGAGSTFVAVLPKTPP